MARKASVGRIIAVIGVSGVVLGGALTAIGSHANTDPFNTAAVSLPNNHVGAFMAMLDGDARFGPVMCQGWKSNPKATIGNTVTTLTSIPGLTPGEAALTLTNYCKGI